MAPQLDRPPQPAGPVAGVTKPAEATLMRDPIQNLPPAFAWDAARALAIIVAIAVAAAAIIEWSK